MQTIFSHRDVAHNRRGPQRSSVDLSPELFESSFPNQEDLFILILSL